MFGTTSENIAAPVVRRLVTESREMLEKPQEGIKLLFNETDVTDIQAFITGPVGTPYENGRFHVRLAIPPQFPEVPPKAYFLTKIFHPNVNYDSGEICVNALKRDWKSELGIAHILLVIKCLLIDPNPDSALNEEAGKLLNEAYKEFYSRARLYTEVHALSGYKKPAAANPEAKKKEKSMRAALRKL